MAKKVGRPQKNTVDFFPHLVGDARMIRRLKKHYGKDGYLVYWITMEALAKTDGHCLDLSNINDLEDHADDCMVEPSVLSNILNDLAEWGRIDHDLWIQGKKVWCEKFIQQIEHVYLYTRSRPAPKKPQIEPETNFLVENYNLIPITRRERRVEKSREEEIIQEEIPENAGEKIQKQITEAETNKRFKITLSGSEKPKGHETPWDIFNSGTGPTFDQWWSLYDIQQQQYDCEGLWGQMNDTEKMRAYSHSWYYVAINTKQYRKPPYSYLRYKVYNGEIIDRRDKKESESGWKEYKKPPGMYK